MADPRAQIPLAMSASLDRMIRPRGPARVLRVVDVRVGATSGIGNCYRQRAYLCMASWIWSANQSWANVDVSVMSSPVNSLIFRMR